MAKAKAPTQQAAAPVAEPTTESQAPVEQSASDIVEEEPTEENTNPNPAPEAPAQEAGPTPAVIPTAQPVASSETPEEIVDDVTRQAPPAPVAAPAISAVAETVEVPFGTSTAQAEGDDENVAQLKIKLEAFAKKINGYGEEAEHFKAAAKSASSITKFIIQYPKIEVLETLLAFFVEHKDGVCAAENFMKGSTTLPKNDEQQVGILFALFSDLANRRVVRVNSSLVINVLKKTEIINFYDRKINGIKASRA